MTTDLKNKSNAIAVATLADQMQVNRRLTLLTLRPPRRRSWPTSCSFRSDRA